MLLYAFYLLKVTLCSGILFGYYWLILKNKIFHHYNRFYLLSAVVLSLVLPLVEINIWDNANAPAPRAIKILQVVSSNEYLDEIVITSRQNNFTAEQALLLFYIVTSIIFFTLFICMLVRIRILFTRHRHSMVEDIYFINTTAKGTPFSFFKYIFWNDHIDPDSITGNRIFRHELAHVQQRHSYDKLFINMVLVFGWCNPFFWLMRKELNIIHEFMADKIAVEDSNTEAFAAMILQATYPQHRFQLTNTFFYSPIKRRLIMLTKNRNPKIGYAGRVLSLPLAVLLFAAFTLKAKTFKNNLAPVYAGKMITVVIDAGHGGSDNGVQNAAGSVSEKDLALSIVKKIKALNSNSNIHIILTRETDIYQSPKDKAAFTKQQQADLFISVHIDGTSKEKAGLFSGMSVWVAKNNYPNSTDSKLFASAIINEFSRDYKLPVSPYPMQRNSGIMVLQESPCPSVLIEAGYITNQNDLAYLQTDAAKEFIAGKILAAVEKYAFAKEKVETGIIIRPTESSENFPGEKDDTIPEINSAAIRKALIIRDGKVISQKDLQMIKPQNIESLSVFKGKEAIDRYGEKGRNGVVIITTRPKETASVESNNVGINSINDTSVQNIRLNGNVKIRNEKNPANQPLYVIDGNVQNNTWGLDSISPDDIESITVLKDRAAIDKYDEKAINGVIEITLKKKDGPKGIPYSGISKNNDSNGATIVKYNNDQDLLVATYNKNNPTELFIPRSDADINQQEQQPDKIFTKVEYEPEFPGGDTAWKNYLAKNLKGDLPLQEGWKPGVYKIVITFIVKANGTISDIKADNYAGSKTAEHCIDLIKKGPKWKPAVQNGLVVNCYRKQPITFVVSK